jgi:hypothetical protein
LGCRRVRGRETDGEGRVWGRGGEVGQDVGTRCAWVGVYFLPECQL